MRVIKDSPMHIGWVSWAIRPPELSLVLVVKATYRLVPDGTAELVEEDEQALPTGAMFWDDDPERSIRYASDLAVLKPRGELLLTGTWRSPNGDPVEHAHLSLKCGAVQKELALIGDRYWQDGAGGMSAPLPFTEMPLTWERSFGGPSLGSNPVGRGMVADPTDAEGRIPLPNIENPAQLVTSTSGHTPTGAFPIPLMWEARRRFVGTYDANWQRSRFPWFPEDFQWDYYMSAPRDQQIEGFWRGDETLELNGLHPSAAHLVSTLPGHAPKAFLHTKEGDALSEVGMVLDTLTIDADTGYVHVVWRGATPCQDQTLQEFEHVFLVHEASSLRQSPAAYRAWFDQKRAEEADEEADHEAEVPDRDFDEAPTTMRDLGALAAPLAPDAEDAEAFDDALTGEVQPPSPETEAARAIAQMQEERAAAIEAQAQTLRDNGIPEETIEEMLAPLRPQPPAPPLSAEAQALADAKAREEQLKGIAEARAAAQETGDETLIAQIEAMAAAIEKQNEPTSEEPEEAEEEETEPELIAIFRQAVREGHDLSGFVFEGLVLTGEDLKGANLAGAAFVRCRLEGVDLRRANLEGTVFQECALRGASLAGANLSEADLSLSHGEGVFFDKANLEGSSASGARFPKSSFEGVQGSAMEWSECDFTESSFASAVLNEASLSESTLDGCSFVQASLVDARLDDGVSAKGACFEQADLSKLRASEGSDFSKASFKWATLNQARFGESNLTEANFSFADLIDADFGQAHLVKTIMLQCDLTQASFFGASMVGAQLGGSNLRQASLESANLHHADFSHANLFEAELWNANTEQTRFDGANLKQTKLAP